MRNELLRTVLEHRFRYDSFWIDNVACLYAAAWELVRRWPQINEHTKVVPVQFPVVSVVITGPARMWYREQHVERSGWRAWGWRLLAKICDRRDWSARGWKVVPYQEPMHESMTRQVELERIVFMSGHMAVGSIDCAYVPHYDTFYYYAPND